MEKIENNEIVKASEFGIEEEKAKQITIGLQPTLQERELLIAQFNEVSKLEITTENLKAFKDLRIKIKDNRTKGIDVWHKRNKEYFLVGGRFVDAVKNKESHINEQMEEKLAAAEKHFENIEKDRLNKLKEDRSQQLAAYNVNGQFFALDTMPNDTFEQLLENSKAAFEKKKSDEEAAEQEKQRIENLHTKRLNYLTEKGLITYAKVDLCEKHFGQYSDDEWCIFYNGLEALKNHNDNLIRIEKLHKERKESILHLWNFLPEADKQKNFGEIEGIEWGVFLASLDEQKHKRELFTTRKEQIAAYSQYNTAELTQLTIETPQKDFAELVETLKKRKADADAKAKADADAKQKLEQEKADREKKEAEDKKAKEKLQGERLEKLKPYFAMADKMDLASLTNETFADLLNNAIEKHNELLAAEQKKKEDEAKEKADAEAKEQLENAGDKVKLKTLIDKLEEIDLYTYKSNNAKSAIEAFKLAHVANIELLKETVKKLK